MPCNEVTDLTRKQFQKLAKQVKDDTRFQSNMGFMIKHPAYLEIISHGQQALPFILEDLEQSHWHWFYALMHITGENPIAYEHRGMVNLMAEDWLLWARKNNLYS